MSKKKEATLRGLKNSFMEDLQRGLLSFLVDLVRKDNSLSLELRYDYVNIYYRGGNLLKLEEEKERIYKPFFDANYISRKENFLMGLPQEIRIAEDTKAWAEKIPLLKSEMDSWFSRNTKLEREFQQMVVWENNNSCIANSTDYFIIDIEYDNKRGARFDMVAVQWDSDMQARKLQSGYKPRLCFIEMKYGDSALSGKSGMVDHVNQWHSYLSIERNREVIKDEMLGLFQQKRELCLIKGLEDNPNKVKSFDDKIDCVFLLANHDPEKSGLLKVIKELEQIKTSGFTVKFCVSNFMGYGLYKENVFTVEEFLNRYARQIYCKS